MRVTLALLALTLGCGSGEGSPAVDDGAVDDSAPDSMGAIDDSPGTESGADTGLDSGLDTNTPPDTGSSKTDSGTVTKDGGSAGGPPMVGPCRMFPPDNPWNQDISALPAHSKASDFASTMHLTSKLHPDWGTFSEGYGIPYNIGTGAPPQKMTWTVSYGAAESDKLKCADGYDFCYPIPASCKIEGPSDSHLLYLDTAGAPNNCTLYELWQTKPFSSGWTAANGAIFHLGTNALRPDGWTSADAAGLPILPGLVRFEEANAGVIKHAIRFTMNTTYQGYIHPATHPAGVSDAKQPPMGLRLRLKSSVAITGYSKQAQAILQAMKTYGIIVADNGSDWYIGGEENDGWKTDLGGGTTIMDTIITAFDNIHGSDFVPVDTGPTL